MNLSKILLLLLCIITISFSNTLIKKEFIKNVIDIDKSSYEVLEFEKMIQNIKVNDKNIIEVEFEDKVDKPLQNIKIFAKEIGYGNLLITFIDNTTIQVDINVKENIKEVMEIAKQLAPDLKIKTIRGKIFLEGTVDNQKIKDSILGLLAKAKADLEEQLVDMSTVLNPDKMIRLKLYVVEIDNNKGSTFNNNWSFTGFDDGKTSADIGLDGTLSVSGGLTAIANRIGSKFNVGLTLQYLQEKGIAQVLDETTLITLEKNESKFHSGGTINARVSTGDTVQFTEITYGLKMNINVQQIIDSKYIKLLISTESSTIDMTYTVDEIPGIKNKTIDTNVIIGNLSTIVLGGLINISSESTEQKIPLLGDIPVLGHLFTSKSNTADNKELVFFITPQIVDPKENDQFDQLKQATSFKNNIVLDKKTSEFVDIKEDNSNLTDYEIRKKEFLGY